MRGFPAFTGEFDTNQDEFLFGDRTFETMYIIYVHISKLVRSNKLTSDSLLKLEYIISGWLGNKSISQKLYCSRVIFLN